MVVVFTKLPIKLEFNSPSLPFDKLIKRIFLLSITSLKLKAEFIHKGEEE